MARKKENKKREIDTSVDFSIPLIFFFRIGSSTVGISSNTHKKKKEEICPRGSIYPEKKKILLDSNTHKKEVEDRKVIIGSAD